MEDLIGRLQRFGKMLDEAGKHNPFMARISQDMLRVMNEGSKDDISTIIIRFNEGLGRRELVGGNGRISLEAMAKWLEPWLTQWKNKQSKGGRRRWFPSLGCSSANNGGNCVQPAPRTAADFAAIHKKSDKDFIERVFEAQGQLTNQKKKDIREFKNIMKTGELPPGMSWSNVMSKYH